MSINQNTIDLQTILDKVNALPEASSGVELPELANPASAGDILSGKEAIDAEGSKITGTITTRTSSNLTASGATVTVPAGYYASQATKSVSTVTQATPSITVNSSGLITASSTQTAGYVSAGTKSATKQLTVQAAKTITPSKSSQTAVASGRYTTGAVTVAAIPSSYVTTTDATAAASEIFSGETAYVNGKKVTGTFTIDSELTEMESKIAQLSTILDSKAAGGSGGGGGGAVIETCTVTLKGAGSSGRPYCYSYTILDNNGAITNVAVTKNSSVDVTLENVVCGSAVNVYWYSLINTICTNCEVVASHTYYFNVYKITAADGGNAEIKATSSGGSND